MTNTENRLPLSPLTNEGLHTERKAAWNDLASWGSTLAEAFRDNSSDYLKDHCTQMLIRANDRRDYVYAALNARNQQQRAGNAEAHRQHDRDEGIKTRRLFPVTPPLFHAGGGKDYDGIDRGAFCKLHPDDAPQLDDFGDFDAFRKQPENAQCPACRDYTRDWAKA